MQETKVVLEFDVKSRARIVVNVKGKSGFAAADAARKFVQATSAAGQPLDIEVRTDNVKVPMEDWRLEEVDAAPLPEVAMIGEAA